MSTGLKIALIGNPNTGKSSIFNNLTGMNQKIANFPGITVEKSIGYFRLESGMDAEVIDLPGTYSLFPKSQDEAIPYEILTNHHHPHYPNLVVFVADASNLKRNLVLLTQVIDLGFPVLLALNMIDQAEKKGITIDIEMLQEELGIPVVATNARKRIGIKKITALAGEVTQPSFRSFIHPDKQEPVPAGLLKEELQVGNTYQALLSLHQKINKPSAGKAISNVLNDLKNNYHFNSGVWQREDILYRYKVVNDILRLTTEVKEDKGFKKKQDRLDAILTHKVGGYFIFFAILFIIFQAIFSWADYPMHLIEDSISFLQDQIRSAFPGGMLNDLITDGILQGLGGVLVFIPQIAFLFFFIAIMEDTGYLARVAFLMDKSMRKYGLNGKSVIPLISGTACAVPAIMASRNIENKKSRLITILITPLISCSARLPVYILLIGLVIPNTHLIKIHNFNGVEVGLLNLRGMMLMGMYVLGFVTAFAAAFVYKLTIKVKEKTYFIMELPVYRGPNWRNVGYTVWKKVRTFVTEAGKIIVAISIILWFLASYSMPGVFSKIDQRYTEMEKLVPGTSIPHLEQMKRSEKLQHSFAGIMGRALEPVISPLGYDWKIGIAIVTSFAAREVFVGTMATLYGLEGDKNPDFNRLKQYMLEAENPVTHRKVYNFATVMSLLFFYAFALQCMSTVTITYKETASWKWTALQFGVMAVLAWVSSFIVYQLLK